MTLHVPTLRSLAPLLLLFLAGCLPSSCRRTESKAIAPTDSLSRQIAEHFTPDTLRLAWQASGPETTPMTYPRTVRFGPDGRLYISDAERNSIFVFLPDGAFVEEITWDGAAVPYLAGLRDDTLVVFSPEARRLDFIVDGAVSRSLPTPNDLPEGPLQYLTATDTSLYFKTVGENFEGYVARLNEQGRIARRVALPGPAWRYAGLLRVWGDTLLSLSGFRPVVDLLPADLASPLDTLALVGFDSPMLRRSYAFMTGETHEAPLLTPSAVPVGGRLFVLNLRPGWLRIDVFDRAGHLQHVLVQDDPGYNRQYYPMDLAVHKPEPDRFEIAVVTTNPEPAVKLYRWQAP